MLMEVKNAERKGGKENSFGTLKKQSEWRRTWRRCIVSPRRQKPSRTLEEP